MTTDGRPSANARVSHPVVATVLAALCVVALVVALWVSLWLRSASESDAADAADRQALQQAAERFSETWNSFDSDQVQPYLEAVQPLLSTKFRTEFEKAGTDVAAGIEQQGLSSEGKVPADDDEVPLVGIASQDDDSAEVLVVIDAQRVTGGQQVLRYFRWQLHFVKVDGEWLVDGFDEI